MSEVRIGLAVRPWLAPNFITLESGDSIAIKDVPLTTPPSKAARMGSEAKYSLP